MLKHASQKLIACVLLKHFPYRVELERSPRLTGREVLIIQDRGGRAFIVDTSAGIDDVPSGTPLREAEARYPLALLREADLPVYEQRFREIIAALERVSPVVEESELGCAYVGLDGLEAMYRGMSGLVQALVAAVPAQLEPRFGIGSGRFPARIAAITAGPGQVLFAPADLREFLADYSVDLLPIDWRTAGHLKRLGLGTLGDVARQRVGPMQAQFGRQGKRIWELAQGIDDTPLVPRKNELRCTATIIFPAPAMAVETILLAAERLLVKLFRKAELRGRYARIALLQAGIARRAAWQRRLAFKEPVGNPVQAMPAIKRILALYPPPGPLEDLKITLTGITGEAARQGSLFIEVRRRDQLRETLSQLEARLGRAPPIHRLREAEPWSRMPERRRVLVAYSP